MVPCLLLAIGSLLLSAAFVANGGSFCSRGTLTLGELELGAKLLILGAAALSIEIAIRLLSSKRFGGHVSNFDFGSGADEHNRAFTADFNSFGHCVQGCLSVLLLPAVELALPWASEVTRIVSCFVAVYPTYNLIKRALDASAFAAVVLQQQRRRMGHGVLAGPEPWSPRRGAGAGAAKARKSVARESPRACSCAW